MSFGIESAFELRLKLKGKGRRWVERFYMGNAGPNLYSTFMDNAKILTLARRMVLALDFAVEDSALHTLSSRPDRKYVKDCIGLGFALDTEGAGSGPLEACNNVTVCLNSIYETPSGAWANRQTRGLRDGWVTGDALTVTPTIPSAGTGLLASDCVANKTQEVALGTWLHAIREKTKYLDKVDPDLNVYDENVWDTILPGYISHRDTGVGRLFRGRAPKAA